MEGNLVDVVQDLDNFVSKPYHLCLLRLFFYLLPSVRSTSGDKETEDAEHLLDFLRILNKGEYSKNRAVHILQYMLNFIGVERSGKLGASKEDLEACGQLEELIYPSLIISVCIDLMKEQFQYFRRYFCSNILECHESNISSCDILLLQLHQQQKIKPTELSILIDGLKCKGVGREDIALRVEHFVRTGEFKRLVDDTEHWITPQQETPAQGFNISVAGGTKEASGQQSIAIEGSVLPDVRNVSDSLEDQGDMPGNPALFIEPAGPGGAPNYYPNSFCGPLDHPSYAISKTTYPSGDVKRYNTADDDNFSQVALFWRHVLTEDEKKRLVANIAGHLKGASEFIQRRAVRNFTQVDPEYGGGIARLLLQYKNKGSQKSQL